MKGMKFASVALVLSLMPVASQAMSPRGLTAEERATRAVETYMKQNQVIRYATERADGGVCGGNKPATIVHVQLVHQSREMDKEGNVKLAEKVETIKTYAVTYGAFSTEVMDSEACME